MEVKFNDLTKKFGNFTAVDHLTMTMTNGVYGLLGVNGAGKTTMMRNLQAEVLPVMEKTFLKWIVNIEIYWDICHRILGFTPNLRCRTI